MRINYLDFLTSQFKEKLEAFGGGRRTGHTASPRAEELGQPRPAWEAFSFSGCLSCHRVIQPTPQVFEVSNGKGGAPVLTSKTLLYLFDEMNFHFPVQGKPQTCQAACLPREVPLAIPCQAQGPLSSSSFSLQEVWLPWSGREGESFPSGVGKTAAAISGGEETWERLG